MGRIDIRTKLSRHVELGFVNEADVVYFMVEARKILDHINGSNFKVLRFYANWCVHIKIDKLKIFGDFFIEVDQLVKQYLKFPDTRTRHGLNSLMETFLSCDNLRSEIREFLGQEGIANSWTDSEKIWNRFLANLKEIILDCEIDIRDSSESIPGSKIRMFRITDEPRISSPTLKNYFTAWEIWIDTSSEPMAGWIPK